MKERSPIDRTALDKEIESSGTKFAVQKLFYDLDMCGVQTLLLSPGAPQSRIEKTLDQLDIESRGVTVRFSYGKALNLPRGFFRDRDKCLNFIYEQNKDYSVIVQEYTKLENSFELYMDEESLYLQVMPGIWEVSTDEGPDIIREEKGKLTIWRYSNPRMAKLANEDGNFYKEERNPFEFDTLLGFRVQLKEYQHRLELLKGVFTPLCCHFYVDDQNRFSFLNVRDFGNFPINDDSPKHFHTINSSSDIDQWDGQKPVLFNARAERDNDTPLVATIKNLVTRGINKVYVNYGILSHPAILLREAGVHVEQSYALYDKRVITAGEDISGPEDAPTAPAVQESQIVTKILEKQVSKEEIQEKKYIVDLNEVSEYDSALVGNKTFNLSKLVKAGFPVPQGFAITIIAFLEWQEQQLESVSANILLQDVQNHILQAYSNLGKGLVAVRSSATTEDLIKSSSAGIYKTTLNVSSEDELINAVIEGFQSFSSRNARQYRLDKFKNQGVDIALLVQELVDAESSGVMFTKDPSGNSMDLVINSTFGLGEPLVAGRVPGDAFHVREDGRVDELITEKEIILTKDGESSLDESRRSKSSLTKEQIEQLAKIGKSMERLFESPQDIEFAIKEGKIWILQSRPITK